LIPIKIFLNIAHAKTPPNLDTSMFLMILLYHNLVRFESFFDNFVAVVAVFADSFHAVCCPLDIPLDISV